MSLIEKIFFWIGGSLSVVSLIEFLFYILSLTSKSGAASDPWYFVILLILSLEPFLLSFLFHQIYPKSKNIFIAYLFGIFLTLFYIAWIACLSLFYTDSILPLYSNEICDSFCGILETLFGSFVFTILLPATILGILVNRFAGKNTRIAIAIGALLFVGYMVLSYTGAFN